MTNDTAKPTDTEGGGGHRRIYHPVTWLRELYRFVVAELDRSFPGGASEAGYYLAITFLVLELLIISVCWLVLGPQRAIAAGAVTPALIVLAMAGLTVVVHKKNGTP